MHMLQLLLLENYSRLMSGASGNKSEE